MSSFLKLTPKTLDRVAGRRVAQTLRQPADARSFLAGSHPATIAIVRLWAIGESLLALPAIAATRAQWPEAKIVVITTPRVADVFRGHAFIDDIQVIQPQFRSGSGTGYVLSFFGAMVRQRKKFDFAIDFEPYFYASALLARAIGKYSVGFDTLTRGRLYAKAVPYRDDQHVVQTNFDLVGAVGVEGEVLTRLVPIAGPAFAKASAGKPAFPLARRAPRSLGEVGSPAANGIALAPGGSVDFRRWPAERFAKVADYLIEYCGCEIVLLGDKADEPVLRDVQAQMKGPARIISNLSLAEVASLLSKCRLTIANDGGLMHVSAAVGTPTLGLFGPETPVRMGPYGPRNRALYHQLEDNPIIHVSRGEVPGMLRRKDDLSRYVRAISADEVIGAVDEMLAEDTSMSRTAVKTSAIEMACIS